MNVPKFTKPPKPIGKFFKVFVKNVPTFTMWARDKNECRRILEGRWKGSNPSFNKVYYSKVVELT